jgi:hypothetical protein
MPAEIKDHTFPGVESGKRNQRRTKTNEYREPNACYTRSRHERQQQPRRADIPEGVASPRDRPPSVPGDGVPSL